MSELANILEESVDVMLDVIAKEVDQPREIIAHAFLSACIKEAFARQQKLTNGHCKSVTCTFKHDGVQYVAEWRDSLTPLVAERYNRTVKELRQRAEDAELIAWGLANNYIMSVGTIWELRIGNIRERMYVGRNEILVFGDDATREALKREKEQADGQ